MATGGFDAIIGNPPYIEYSKTRSEYSISTQKIDVGTGNLYAFTTERCIELSNSKTAMGLIVPVSLVSTQRMASLQSKLAQNAACWFSNYAERPAKLFNGAEVLLTIVLTVRGHGNQATYATGLRKWAAEQRDGLFATTSYIESPSVLRGFVIPKYAASLEPIAISKMLSMPARLANAFRRNGVSLFYRIGGGRYWKVFTTQSPKFVLNGVPGTSSRESVMKFESELERDLACALLSSSIFFWFFSVTTNGRDLNPIDLNDFPIDFPRLTRDSTGLAQLSRDLMIDYQAKSRLKVKQSTQTGQVEYQEFYPRLSKPLIDEIDMVLAKHYGFTQAELDHIINYDIKYRMGQTGDDTDD